MDRAYMIVDADGQEQGPFLRTNDLTIEGAANGLSWKATKAPYDIYCAVKGHAFGRFGFVGQSDFSGFIDDNIWPDFSDSIDLAGPVKMRAA